MPLAIAEFRVVAEQISTRDLVQEYLDNMVSPTLSDWSMSKLKGTKKKNELVRLPYRFKFEKQFKEPCQEWLEMIETMCNEILGNYTKKEDQLMTAAFSTRPKRRLNRVMDALNIEYPDYERLSKGAEGTKRKRVVSVLSRHAARMVKEDEEALKKRKFNPEPKVATSKKRKTATPEPKMAEIEEEAPSTPSAPEVEEILKVMTESLPIKLLSPLGPHLTKLLQNKDEPSTAKKAVGPKKRRIVTVMQAIEETPPPTSASKMTPAVEAATSVEAATAEATILESTLSAIDKVLLDLAAEETTAATEGVLATEETAAVIEEALAAVLEKGKEIVEDTSEEKSFNFQNLVGQELSKAEKEELQEYAISCGYQPGAMLFGGINEEALGCIRDRTGGKIISTLSKSVCFPKLEADISSYRRQHIVGNLFYSNFKVKLFSSVFYCFVMKQRFLTKVILHRVCC
jgi:heat shock protein HslJ